MHTSSRSAAFPAALLTLALAGALPGAIRHLQANARFGILRRTEALTAAEKLVRKANPTLETLRLDAEKSVAGSHDQRRFWCITTRDANGAHLAFVVLDADTGRLAMYGARAQHTPTSGRIRSPHTAAAAGRDWLRALGTLAPQQQWQLAEAPIRTAGFWKLSYTAAGINGCLTLDLDGRPLCISIGRPHSTSSPAQTSPSPR
jgi:hypothetical protein